MRRDCRLLLKLGQIVMAKCQDGNPVSHIPVRIASGLEICQGCGGWAYWIADALDNRVLLCEEFIEVRH